MTGRKQGKSDKKSRPARKNLDRATMKKTKGGITDFHFTQTSNKGSSTLMNG